MRSVYLVMAIPTVSVDTYFFLRYLTGEPSNQAEQADKVLREAEKGRIQLIVPPMVIAEIMWVLESSFSNLSKEEASEKVIAILNMRNTKSRMLAYLRGQRFSMLK